MANVTVAEIRRLLINKSIKHSSDMDFSGLDLSGTDLSGANLSNVIYDQNTILKCVNHDICV